MTIKSGMDIRLLLFLLVFSLVISEANAQTVKWLVAELRSFHIVPSCLNEGICREPQFRSILTINGGRLSSAIGLNQTAVDGIYDRVVFNPLQQVDLKDFLVSAEVVGTDPSFHFPRVCDSGRVERLVANNTHNENESLFRVLLTGRCFQTTLFVHVYYKHCPWCLFDASSIVTNEERVTTSISTTLLLAGFCVASGATTVLLLTICTFYYKSNRELRRKLKRSDTASSPSTQITESHYDLPWKTYGYRNLPARPWSVRECAPGGRVDSSLAQQSRTSGRLVRHLPRDHPPVVERGTRVHVVQEFRVEWTGECLMAACRSSFFRSGLITHVLQSARFLFGHNSAQTGFSRAFAGCS
ncbi:hypothetical protein M3Y99_01843100 [Aphelenchoides fujianensis]|nr:hypothetical protein M3Y99_01843100 [Aphelenchoides fujianensis]